MSSLILTPTSIDYLDYVVKDYVTGKLYFPTLTFNTMYNAPFYVERDPLNNDSSYHRDIIATFYLRLVDKWLYNDREFEKLCRFFSVDVNDKEGKVELNKKVDKETEIDEKHKKYVLRYIEKYFISRKFVEKVIRQYVKKTNIKWYDLLSNSILVREYIAHKLKKLIIHTIEAINEREKKN
jgi:hypothetical protein